MRKRIELPSVASPITSEFVQSMPPRRREKRYELKQFEDFFEKKGKHLKNREFFTDSAAIKWYWSKQRRLRQIRHPHVHPIQNKVHAQCGDGRQFAHIGHSL